MPGLAIYNLSGLPVQDDSACGPRAQVFLLTSLLHSAFNKSVKLKEKARKKRPGMCLLVHVRLPPAREEKEDQHGDFTKDG